MEFIVMLIVCVVFGFICQSMAEKRGREKYLGFLMGFIFGIWAVLGYALAGDTSEKKAELIAEAMKKSKKK